MSAAGGDPKRRGRKAADGRGSVAPYKTKTWTGWRGRVMVGYLGNGKPDIRTVYAATEKACWAKLDAIIAKVRTGTLADADKERDTVAAYLERWVEATRTSVRPRTHIRYAQLVNKHLKPRLGRHKLSALRPDHVQQMYAGMMGEQDPDTTRPRYAPRTVHHCHRVLHRALEMAVRWGYIPRNVCDAVEAPKVPRRELAPPTPEQVGKLLDTAEARGDRHAALWATAVYSGCRLGELLALTWGDVDLDRATLTVQRTLIGTKRGVPTYGEPKSASSRRTIGLDPDGVAILRAHRDRQSFERQRLGDAYAAYDLVFATSLGTAYAPSEISHRFKDALERAGLPRAVRFHDLRHANGTAMFAAGVHPKAASLRLGHSTIQITLDLYTHAVQELDADAAAKIGAVFKRGRAAQ